MSTLVRDTQAKLIAMLLKNPKLFDVDQIDIKVFSEPFNEMYKILRMSYEKYRFVDVELLDEVGDGVDEMLVEDLLLKDLDTSVSAFRHLAAFLVDEWKKREILRYVDYLKYGKMDVVEFMATMRIINDTQTPDIQRLTPSKIDAFLKKADTSIKFEDFKKLNKCKINEHDFVVLAGGTGQGKTALAINLAMDLMKNYPVLYINIELSEDTVIKRMMASYTDTTMDDIDNRFVMPQFKWEQMRRLMPFVSEHEMYLVTGSQTIESIRALVSHMKQDKHFIVIVDHIGRISTNKERYQAMTEISIAIRNLALDYNCTVLGLCQLNRDFRNVDTPSNNLLRDSGEIEQSARKVMFIWQKSKGDNLGLYMWFTKNDSAMTGQIKIKYDREKQKIEEIDDAELRTS